MEVFEVPEKSTAKYTATLKDEDSAAIALTDLTTITVTLYTADDANRTVLNSRDEQDIRNTNNGTVHATSGLLTLELQPNDNAISDTSLPRERHIMQFDFTYSGGTKTGRHQVMLVVRNLDKTT